MHAELNDGVLADRVREILTGGEGVSERRMFGGVCFMIRGNMCLGTWKGSLIVRLDKKDHDKTLAEPHTKTADITGRVMKGWALVEPSGTESDNDLKRWIHRAATYAETLPPK